MSSELQATGANPANLPDGFDKEALNDTQLAKYFSRSYFNGDLKFASALGWFRWDGTVWNRVDEREVRRELSSHLEVLNNHLRVTGAPVEKLQAINRRLSSASLKALVSELETQVFINPVFFDNKPHLLNVKNGVIDLKTKELLPHERGFGFTKMVAVDYIPEATHPDWLAALDALSPEVADHLQVAVGQAVTGYSPLDDRVNFLLGPRASNGKSTMVLALLGTFGDFAKLVSEKLLAGNKFDHPTEQMQLFGARIAVIEELPQSFITDHQLKLITGRKMSARYIRQDNVEWISTHTVFVTTNHHLEFEYLDNAVKRRIRLFPFEKEYVDTPTAPHHLKKDHGLRERLLEGAEGQHEAVLAWSVHGSKRWFQNDRQMPPESPQMSESRIAWEKEADPLGGFFEEYLIPSKDSYVASVELLAAFNHYLEARGFRRWRAAQIKAAFEGRDDLKHYRSRVDRTVLANGRSIPEIPDFQPTTSAQPVCWYGMRFIVEREEAP
jgi:putative DNA primase/helicase